MSVFNSPLKTSLCTLCFMHLAWNVCSVKLLKWTHRWSLCWLCQLLDLKESFVWGRAKVAHFEKAIPYVLPLRAKECEWKRRQWGSTHEYFYTLVPFPGFLWLSGKERFLAKLCESRVTPTEHLSASSHKGNDLKRLESHCCPSHKWVTVWQGCTHTIPNDCKEIMKMRIFV